MCEIFFLPSHALPCKIQTEKKLFGRVHFSYLLQQMGDGKGDTTTHGEAGNFD